MTELRLAGPDARTLKEILDSINEVDVGNCADCMYSISDGDLGFICCNGKSEQYGQYSGWCDKYKEADDG